jgi:hypothetical protein
VDIEMTQGVWSEVSLERAEANEHGKFVTQVVEEKTSQASLAREIAVYLSR